MWLTPLDVSVRLCFCHTAESALQTHVFSYLWSPASWTWAQTVWWGRGRAGRSRAPRWRPGWGGPSRSRRAAELGGAGAAPGSRPAAEPPPPRGRAARCRRTPTALREPQKDKSLTSQDNKDQSVASTRVTLSLSWIPPFILFCKFLPRAANPNMR